MKIRYVEIKNFRGIRELSWTPVPHVNCLIGPGDAGKTTIIDAIELTLAPRYQVTFDDSDFYEANPDNPIIITVTLGDLPAEFIAIPTYGNYTRGWDATKQQITDEPEEASGMETVLSARLTVDRTLEPKWTIYTDRYVDDPREERSFKYEHRQMMAPTRLGVYTDRHLGWGRQSILTRLSGNGRIGTEMLAQSARAARQHFAETGGKLFEDVLDKVGKFASLVGVKLGPDISARLDIQGISINSGGISLHEGEIPLRLLGAGSSRLLVAALQNQAGDSTPFVLIDEVEHGLEPHRISRLLRYLKSARDGKQPQIFLTTHSPVVLQELSVDDVAVVHRKSSTGEAMAISAKNAIASVDAQACIRTNPNAYLARSVLVCEGKTEIGIVRGLDQYWANKNKEPFATAGVALANGRGKDQSPPLAKHFCKLEYRVALFMDSDQDPNDATILSELKDLGVTIIRWEKGKATEDVLFGDLSDAAVKKLIQLLQDEENLPIPEQINILADSGLVSGWDNLKSRCTDPKIRKYLATCAKRHSWLKERIALLETIGLCVLGPHLSDLKPENATCIKQLRTWIDCE